MIQSPGEIRLPVRFYKSAAGKEPVRDWLRQLSRAQRKAIGEDIKTVQLGWPLGMPLVRKLGADLWEVRAALPETWARVLFTVVHGEIVLLHGFLKASRKTPGNELATAQRRLRETHGKR
ncbi:MAG: type II toxin-antitoxin system RelE/ParE family toxin [Burkholderiales bacterium]